MTENIWQTSLETQNIILRPMLESDYESMLLAASDPKIWEQHPEKDRFKPENFERFFKSGINSQGAFSIIDKKTSKIIGSSRFANYDAKQSKIEIGYTFLSCDHWGTGTNKEMKNAMVEYAFKFVGKIHFYIGELNIRSRRAVEKLGATHLSTETKKLHSGDSYQCCVYELQRTPRS